MFIHRRVWDEASVAVETLAGGPGAGAGVDSSAPQQRGSRAMAGPHVRDPLMAVREASAHCANRRAELDRSKHSGPAAD